MASSSAVVKAALAKAAAAQKAAREAAQREWEDFEDSLYDPNLRPLLMDKGASFSGPVVVRSASIGTKIPEAAGAAHDLLVRVKAGLAVKPVKRAEAAPTAGGGASSAAAEPESDLPSADERIRYARYAREGNWYALLGLTAENLSATGEMIVAAHRKMVPRFHPDKARAAGGGRSEGKTADADTENVYLAIGKALEVLMDDDKRRAYDSHYECDDSIPSGTERGDFFAVYGPVFSRNARFSTIKPVPALGGPDADDASVKKFYSFWHAFDTWRDFSHLGKEKIETADTRDEKRYMEKKNKAAAADGKKEELKRIDKLTTLAYARDPRVAAYKAKEEAAKQALKDAKMATSKTAQAEAAKVAAAELAAAAAAAEAAAKASKSNEKFEKEREKKMLARSKAALRKLGVAGGTPSDVDVDAALGKIEPAAALALFAVVFGDDAVAQVASAAAADAEKVVNKKGDGGPAGLTFAVKKMDAFTAEVARLK